MTIIIPVDISVPKRIIVLIIYQKYMVFVILISDPNSKFYFLFFVFFALRLYHPSVVCVAGSYYVCTPCSISA